MRGWRCFPRAFCKRLGCADEAIPGLVRQSPLWQRFVQQLDSGKERVGNEDRLAHAVGVLGWDQPACAVRSVVAAAALRAWNCCLAGEELRVVFIWRIVPIFVYNAELARERKAARTPVKLLSSLA